MILADLFVLAYFCCYFGRTTSPKLDKSSTAMPLKKRKSYEDLEKETEQLREQIEELKRQIEWFAGVRMVPMSYVLELAKDEANEDLTVLLFPKKRILEKQSG